MILSSVVTNIYLADHPNLKLNYNQFDDLDFANFTLETLRNTMEFLPTWAMDIELIWC